MHRRCLIPGSFDPITTGHLHIFERAARLYDSVVVAVLNNSAKRPLLSAEQRIVLIEKAAGHLPHLSAIAFDGLTIECARAHSAGVLLRGLRSAADLEYEQPIALLNRMLAPEIETVFLLSEGEYGHISSRMVREIGRLGGDLSGMVPEAIYADIMEVFGR